MKKIIILFLLTMGWGSVKGQTIVEAEYFINSDPGIGNGFSVAPDVPLDSAAVMSMFNGCAYGLGVHTLCVRYKNNTGTWGMVDCKNFYLQVDVPPPSSTGVQDIALAEYYVDVDPGIGNGIPLEPDLSEISNLDSLVEGCSYGVGIHQFCLRFQDDTGHWGMVECKNFYVTEEQPPAVEPTGAENIVAAEYYVNEDPGIGNGFTVDPTVVADSTGIFEVFDGCVYGPGVHRLCVRYQDDVGYWSQVACKNFYVVNILPGDSTLEFSGGDILPIDAAEYFIGTDPGEGNGTVLPISTPGTEVAVNGMIDVSGFSPGTYTLFVRYRNTEGVWGAVEGQEFTLQSPINPAGDSEFTYLVNGAEVSFTNASSDANSFSWNFGDGTSSEEENPVHTYNGPGIYEVALTINECAAFIQSVTVLPPPNNDLCDAIELTEGADCIEGYNIASNLEANEPLLTGCYFYQQTDESVWYTFTPQEQGQMTIDVFFTDFETIGDIRVFTLNGDCNNLSNLTSIGCGSGNSYYDYSIGLNTNYNTFNYIAGTTYYISVDGRYGGDGYFCISAKSNLICTLDNFSTNRTCINDDEFEITVNFTGESDDYIIAVGTDTLFNQTAGSYTFGPYPEGSLYLVNVYNPNIEDCLLSTVVPVTQSCPQDVTCTPGCEEADACNYNPLADCGDNSSCDYSCYGCTDVMACNYDMSATIDDNSCLFEDCLGECGGSVVEGTTCNDDDATTINDEYNSNCECMGMTVPGCTDVCTANYDASATVDDGSCTEQLLGCTNPAACNFNPLALCDDASCDLVSCYGCTNNCSLNYDPTATLDDGSCEAELLGCTNPMACNYDANALCDNDSCDLTSCAGCTNPCSPNYNASATLDDDSCEAELLGCTDANAINYDADALCDDDSCEYGSECPEELSSGTTFVLVDDHCYDGSIGGANASSILPDGYELLILLVDVPTDTIIDGNVFGLFTVGPEAATYSFHSLAIESGFDLSPYIGSTLQDFANLLESNGGSICGDLDLTSSAVLGLSGCGVLGCTNSCATNYNPDATQDDGSCTYPFCDDNCALTTDTFDSINCDCVYTEPNVDDACDLTNDIFDAENCIIINIPPDCDDGDETTSDAFDANNCLCTNEPITDLGCTDEMACNYDATAILDDGSCSYSPCYANCDFVVTNVNLLPGALCDDGASATLVDIVDDNCFCTGLLFDYNCLVSVNPPSVYVGTDYPFIVTVTDPDTGLPLGGGIWVNYYISGANGGTYGFGQTDGNGQIVFSYPTGFVGTDTITVISGYNTLEFTANIVGPGGLGGGGGFGVGIGSVSGAPDGPNEVGEEACTTVTIENEFGEVVTGVVVSIESDGANGPTIEFQTSSLTGEVTFCGLGLLVGQDVCVITIPESDTLEITIDWVLGGCLNPDACNYNPEASYDDDSCNLPDCEGNCDGDNTGPAEPGTACDDGNAATENDVYNEDCECEGTTVSILGCTNECSPNYNPLATNEDGSCEEELLGCTDITANNYDENALCDDDSCTYDDCLSTYQVVAEVVCLPNNDYNLLLTFDTNCDEIIGYIVTNINTNEVVNVEVEDINVILGPFDSGTGYALNISTVNAPENAIEVNSMVVDCITTILTLIHFNGRVEEKGNLLNWSTASENGTMKFMVERSLNGFDFETIGTVKARGSNNTVQEYDFLDEDVNAETYYYRLVELEESGVQKVVSNIVVLYRKMETPFIEISPIPAHDFVQIQMNDLAQGQWNIRVMNILGQVLQESNIEIEQSDQQLNLDLNAFAKGTYFLIIENADQQLIERFIK